MPDSSPDTDTVVETPVSQAAPTTVSDAATSPSSSEPTAGNMLDAVKAAIEPKAASPAAEKPGESADPDSQEPKPDSEAKEEEFSEDELKGLHEKTQRRFRTLTSRLKAKDEELNTLKPKAEQYDKIDGFIKNAGLQNEEVGELLNIGAMLKPGSRQDLKGALDRMMPIVRAVEDALGLSSKLPATLQQQVDQGYLTEAHAREIVRANAAESLANQRVEKTAEQQAEERQQRELKTLVDSTTKAAGDWEAKKAAGDPDWHLKRKDVADYVELAIARKGRELGTPYFPNAAEAVKLSEDALKAVNDRFKRFGAKPVEMKPVTPQGASNRSSPAPKSILDVVRQTVGAGAAT